MRLIRTTIWFMIILNSTAYAAKALYSITPLSSAVLPVPLYFKAYVDYLVTNQTKQTQTLVFQGIPGLSQFQEVGKCTSPFTLAPNASCTLELEADGNIIQSSGSLAAPTVCSQGSNFFCSRPERANYLFAESIKYSYILTSNYGFLSYCTITSGGALENCQSFYNADISYASGVAIIPAGFVYTANQDLNTIAICSPAATPQSMTCESYDAGGGVFQSPRTAYINNGYFYTLNYDNDAVIKCNVNATTGALSACVSTGAGFSGPLGSMTISNGYAYIPNSSNSTVSVCAVNATTGELSGCTLFDDPSFASPSGITISGQYAYIVGVWTDGIVSCQVSSVDGTLSQCQNNYVLTTPVPSGINNINGYLYVNEGDGISKCALTGSGGVAPCQNMSGNFYQPTGNIAFVQLLQS